eukprot:10080578-Lingulodinium_polyedra.AAC.1
MLHTAAGPQQLAAPPVQDSFRLSEATQRHTTLVKPLTDGQGPRPSHRDDGKPRIDPLLGLSAFAANLF